MQHQRPNLINGGRAVVAARGNARLPAVTAPPGITHLGEFAYYLLTKPKSARLSPEVILAVFKNHGHSVAGAIDDRDALDYLQSELEKDKRLTYNKDGLYWTLAELEPKEEASAE